MQTQGDKKKFIHLQNVKIPITSETNLSSNTITITAPPPQQPVTTTITTTTAPPQPNPVTSTTTHASKINTAPTVATASINKPFESQVKFLKFLKFEINS